MQNKSSEFQDFLILKQYFLYHPHHQGKPEDEGHNVAEVHRTAIRHLNIEID